LKYRDSKVGTCFTLTICLGLVVLSKATDKMPADVRDGVFTEAQAKLGQKIYDEKCSACHLASLEGGTNESPALKGDTFTTQWDGKPLRALYSRILSTMPSNDPGSLSEKETLNLVAYLLQKNGYPSGKAALDTPEELNSIRFVRAK
jgi:cytochrome c